MYGSFASDSDDVTTCTESLYSDVSSVGAAGESSISQFSCHTSTASYVRVARSFS